MSRYYLRGVVFVLCFVVGSMIGSLVSSPRPIPRVSKRVSFEANVPQPLHDNLGNKDGDSPAKTPTIERQEEKKRLTCNDRRILPIWRYIKNDEGVKESPYVPDGDTDCSQIVDAKYVDLNNDGNRELFIRGKTVPLCGAVGNCAFWIFQKHGKRYRVLLDASDYVDRSEMGDQILKTRTKGYSDILLRGHFSAGETGFYYHKFDGKKYRDSKCLYEVPDYLNSTDEKPKWHFITCKQFYRQIEEEIASGR